MHYTHTSVLLDEVLEALNIRTNGIYIDCTYGRGGHSKAILEKLDPSGLLFALDKDPDAVKSIDTNLSEDKRFIFTQCSFEKLDQFASDYALAGKVDGILFDLGISSPQIDNPDRGFSFTRNGFLDMRMDYTNGISAAEWLNSAKESEIRKVLKIFGEERYAGKIANRIVEARNKARLETTLQLAELISRAVPSREKNKHPATRTFQAIRIYINNELGNLEQALKKSVDMLARGGRLVVISFHSLEDRIVKRFMKLEEKGDNYPQYLPVSQNEFRPTLRIIGKPVYPKEEEIEKNVRARSAVMRVAEKIN